MNRIIKIPALLSLIGGLSACASIKAAHDTKSAAVTSPPCHFQAGRLDISWESVYDIRELQLPVTNGTDSLPSHFTAYKINTQSLFSHLQGLDAEPYNKRAISVPVNDGTGCILFHLEPSGTLSPELQKKYSDIKSWKGNSIADPTVQLRLDFDGKSIQAAIIKNEKTEFLSPWQDNQGTTYYLLYKKEDSGHRHIPVKQY